MLGSNIDYSSESLSNEVNSLEATETLELINLEAKVEKSLRAFFEIGLALRSIRDLRLYRQDYTTFEDYCLNRWEMSRRTTDQLIAAASTYENFQRHGAQIVPTSERQIRALTSLPPEKQLEIWNEAVSSAPKGKITSNHVAQVVKDYKRKTRENLNNTNLSNTVLNFEITESHPPRTNDLSCWNCHFCSGELIKDDPHNFYCYKLGKLNFVEKDASERAKTCEFWTKRRLNKEVSSSTGVSNNQLFCLTLQLPAHWQAKMENLAKNKGLDLEDWITEVLAQVLETSDLPKKSVH